MDSTLSTPYSIERLYAELRADREWICQTGRLDELDEPLVSTLYVLVRLLNLRSWARGAEPLTLSERFELDRWRAHAVPSSMWQCERRGWDRHEARRRGEAQARFIAAFLPSLGPVPPPWTVQDEAARALRIVRRAVEWLSLDAQDDADTEFAQGGWLAQVTGADPTRPRPREPPPNHVALRAALHRAVAAGDGGACDICLEAMHEPCITACGHFFGGDCIRRVLAETAHRPRCTMCRASLRGEEDLVEADAPADGASDSPDGGADAPQEAEE